MAGEDWDRETIAQPRTPGESKARPGCDLPEALEMRCLRPGGGQGLERQAPGPGTGAAPTCPSPSVRGVLTAQLGPQGECWSPRAGVAHGLC